MERQPVASPDDGIDQIRDTRSRVETAQISTPVIDGPARTDSANLKSSIPTAAARSQPRVGEIAHRVDETGGEVAEEGQFRARQS